MNIGALYRLTKPGVTFGNLMTTIAGYLLAAEGQIDWLLFLMLTVGTGLIIASACVINNYLDQDIDAVMARTKKRPLLTGEVTSRQALVFGILLLVIGTTLLLMFTSLLVAGVGLIGWITYVWLYGALSKRRSVHGTLVGAISGAVPILAGYLAGSGGFDMGAALVFAALFFWQMPEFYSIAIYRKKEYESAHIPLISIVKGEERTKKHIFAHTIAFVAAAMLLPILGYTGITYSIITGLSCLYWLSIAWSGLTANENSQWARRMFRFSMVILLVFSLMISVDNYLP